MSLNVDLPQVRLVFAQVFTTSILHCSHFSLIVVCEDHRILFIQLLEADVTN